MSAFFITIPNLQIADQIAILLNKYNNLKVQHNKFSILNGATNYFIEIAGDKVIGCAGFEKKENGWTLIKHVCVEKEYRNKDIGKKLILKIIEICETEGVYCLIHEDNISSQWLFKNSGFNFMRMISTTLYNLIMVGRKRNKC